MKKLHVFYQSCALLPILFVVSFFSLLFATDPQQRYFIKDGYASRAANAQFDDTGNEDGYQDEVPSDNYPYPLGF